jgi:hypothetical protein
MNVSNHQDLALRNLERFGLAVRQCSEEKDFAGVVEQTTETDPLGGLVSEVRVQ